MPDTEATTGKRQQIPFPMELTFTGGDTLYLFTTKENKAGSRDRGRHAAPSAGGQGSICERSVSRRLGDQGPARLPEQATHPCLRSPGDNNTFCTR